MPETLDLLDKDDHAPKTSASSDMPDLKAKITEKDDKASEKLDIIKEKELDITAAPKGESEDDSATSDSGDDTAAKPEHGKPGKGVQKRIDELTRKSGEAERRAVVEKARADEAERLLQERIHAEHVLPVADKDDVRPDRRNFDDPDAYVETLSTWTARQAVRQDRIQRQQEEQQNRVNASYDRTLKSWQDSRVAAVERYPDYADVAERDDIPIATHVGFAILSSEKGHDIAYYLGKHPDEAARISALSPLQSAIAIGELGAKLTESVTVSKTPAPVKPIGSRSSASKAPNDESMDEYAARRTAEMAAARKRR